MIEVSAEIDIVAAPADVAAVMFDPARERDWLPGITSVELLDPALVAGARVRHEARVMNREVRFTTEVETIHFPHLLVLRVLEGGVTGQVRYEIHRSGSGCRVRVRGAADPGGLLGRLPAGLVSAPARAMLDESLRRLKEAVEAGSPVA
jgi:carbon monoxide dehydrogenase subunit G